MEKNIKKESMCTCGCGEHNHHNHWWRLIKVFVGCFIILLALLVGMAVGRKQALTSGMWGYSGAGGSNQNMAMIMKQPGALAANGTYLTAGSGGMMPPAQGQGAMLSKIDPNTQRVAGVITDINGTAITVLDNGGNSRTMYSTSTTDIYSGTSEIPLTNLKAKEFIVGYVFTKNNQQVAARIEVSQ